MVKTKPQPRKTYSLEPDRANGLARVALQFGTELGRTVTRQDVLDEVVLLMEVDPAVQKKVLQAIKKRG